MHIWSILLIKSDKNCVYILVEVSFYIIAFQKQLVAIQLNMKGIYRDFYEDAYTILNRI